MADFGYGYSWQECVDLATDFAVQIGKRESDKPLSMKWMKGFLSRWPDSSRNSGTHAKGTGTCKGKIDK